MATQIQTATAAAQSKVQDTTSDALSTLDAFATNISGWARGLLDRFIPAEKRAELLAKLQEFMLANPKISVCLYTRYEARIYPIECLSLTRILY